MKFDQVLKAVSEGEGEFSLSERTSLCAELLSEFSGEGRDAWDTLFTKIRSRLDADQQAELWEFLREGLAAYDAE